ncbi:hypothetical protein [Bradyrhizobium ganzhouense]|uniref:hypothetical protein n=1 Tax=Bradyrhizobium ganzhouense TaxID=1179767 RepID=UPI003CEB7C61
MTALRDVITYVIRRRPGITDRELTEAIYGSDQRHRRSMPSAGIVPTSSGDGAPRI